MRAIIKISAVIGLFFTQVQPALSQTVPNLDAHIWTERPTLRSEIQRGQDAAFDCSMKAMRISPEDGGILLDCVNEAESENRQKMGQRFAPFDAGLWFWSRNMLKITTDHFPTASNKSALDVAEAGVNGAERKLHLTDAAIDRAIKRN